MLWTVVSFIGFTIAVAVISYIKTKGDDQTTAEGYFLAGRGLPGIVIAGSLLLTNISAEQLVGTNGQTWATNMSPISFEVGAAIACLILAFFAAPRYLKSGISTIPEMLGLRYDRTNKLWFSIAYIILYICVQIPVILYSGALVFENIFGLSGILHCSKLQAVVILCIAITIVGSCYAIFGGLKAVAVSDTVNGVLLIVGGFMIPFLALHILGKATWSEGFAMLDGMKHLIEVYPEKLNSICPADVQAPEVPWPTIFLGLFFLNTQSWCTHQSFIQRLLAAQNLKEAQKGALFCACMKILGFLYLALPGVIAYALFELQGNQVSTMDDAYPQLITQVVPAPLMGFFAAVMFGAIISSFNSVLNSVNTMFTMDIYHEFINKDADELHLVGVGKKVGIVFAVITMVIGPMIYFVPAGLKTFLDSLVMLIGLPVLSGIFGGFFFKHLPKYAARFILVFHVAFYGLFLLTMSGSVHYLWAISVLLPVEFLMLCIMNTRNKVNQPEPWVQEDVRAVDLTPWKYRWVMAAIVFVGVLVVYAVFSPLGIVR